MTKITIVTSDVCNQLRADINSAFKDIENKYGITLQLGSIRYTETSFGATLNMTVGQGDEREKIIWDQNLWQTGLKEEDFGAEITVNGKPAIICGFKPKARKNCIRFYFKGRPDEVRVTDIDTIKKCLARKAA